MPEKFPVSLYSTIAKQCRAILLCSLCQSLILFLRGIDAMLQDLLKAPGIRERYGPADSTLLKITPWRPIADQNRAACQQRFRNDVTKVLSESREEKKIIVRQQNGNSRRLHCTVVDNPHMGRQTFNRVLA